MQPDIQIESVSKMKADRFGRVRVVMVETSHPGNIGGAARAMKNMFLSQLWLVNPALFPSADATARASGADDLLATARVVATLDEALAGCSLVFGASARSRTIPWPMVDARACGERSARAAAEGREVAILFGREQSGLTNSELERCNFLVHIPANPAYSSLNIAAAIQVIAYEVAMAINGPAHFESEEGEAPATAEEVEQFHRHLEAALVEIGFLDPSNPRQLMRRLRRLFNRASLEKSEVNILRGVLTAAQKKGRG